MKYFNVLPKIAITSQKGTTQVARNIMARTSVVPSIMKNPLLYYSYDIQEGDTPEIVADKYYGSSYRYWIVMLSNQLFDPLWDWPLNYNNFISYLNDKYANSDINAIQSYQKTITQQDTFGNVTTNTVTIGQDEYNSLTPYTKTLNFPSGSITVNVDKSTLSFYDYEFQQNEAKRNIKLLNKVYAQQLETELQNLMRV